MSRDISKSAENAATKNENSGFLSNLFRRSLSLQSPDELGNTIHNSGRRARGFSESSLDDFEIEGNEAKFQEKPITRYRSATEVDGNSTSTQVVGARRRSLTLSAMLLGPRLSTTHENQHSSLIPTSTEDLSQNDSNQNAQPSIDNLDQEEPQPNRQTSQTDHLNKKLLDSFLTRINSVAANIIDPSGRGENIGQVYTDDVMMDRIIRRVESDQK